MLKYIVIFTALGILLAGCSSPSGDNYISSGNNNSAVDGFGQNADGPGSQDVQAPGDFSSSAGEPTSSGVSLMPDRAICVSNYFSRYGDYYRMLANSGFTVVVNTCNHYKVKDENGETVFELKLKDEDCKLEVEIKMSDFELDTSYHICYTD